MTPACAAWTPDPAPARPQLCLVDGCEHEHDPAWVRPVSSERPVYAAAQRGKVAS